MDTMTPWSYRHFAPGDLARASSGNRAHIVSDRTNSYRDRMTVCGYFITSYWQDARSGMPVCLKCEAKS